MKQIRITLFVITMIVACSFGQSETATLPAPRFTLATAQAITATAFYPSTTPIAESATPTDASAQTVTQAVVPQGTQATAVAQLGGGVVYGIHLGDPIGNSLLASQLGASVVKVQFRWSLVGNCNGTDFSSLDAVVSSVANAGMKTLVSVVTAPPCSNQAGSANYPPDDPQQMGNLLSQMAGRYGANLWGLEVWNEENLDREWGVPDPSRYTELLRVSYKSIKEANPNVVVIAGALAPTWHNPPQHWDDIVFYQGVAQAGGGQYTDCIGAHVNALTFTPSAKSSDGIFSVNGNTHHSWYFYDTVWGYYQAFGKTIPICLTEYGVATPGAIGGLPAGFEWAQNTTLDQQAQWLTEGMQLSEQWGIVKSLVVWNLDFSPLCGGCVDEKSPYSILDGDYSPLPAYLSIRQALGQ